MTIAQVAAVLGISTSRVRHDVLAGRLRALKEGRDLFVEITEFERYRDARPKRRGRPPGSKDRQPRGPRRRPEEPER